MQAKACNMRPRRSKAAKETPASNDALADRRTFSWIFVFFAAFLVVDILSEATEYDRNGLGQPPAHTAVYEITSVAVILALFPFLCRVTSRVAPGRDDWRAVFAIHAGASIAFSIVHVAAMVALRKIIFLVWFQTPYTFTDNLLRDFIYEYRKDALTYILIVFFITFGRLLDQQRRELAAAREDAKRSQKLTLKCGGRSIWVDASDVLWAKSASNYVEVAANGKTHLARATLTAIETQLADAGAAPVRAHRSYVVNKDHIRAIQPTGEGDVKIEMSDGSMVPGSRRYRDRLPQPA